MTRSKTSAPNDLWVLFDTNVYITAIRDGLSGSAFELLERRLPRTYLASVVSAELRAGVVTQGVLRAVRHFTARSKKVGSGNRS